MSSHNNNNKHMAPPSFSGNTLPDNISLTLPGEEGEESYRRVVGMPSSFANTANLTQMATSMPSSRTGQSPLFSTVEKKEYMPPTSSRVMQRERFTWNLPETRTLPEFYPLERTAVFVPHTTCTEVSSRISDVLRQRSIEASFDNSMGKAKCTSTDGVEFRVFLYRGREQYHHGIIVEVQRRFGTSINFYNDAKAILDAAKGKSPSSPPPPLTTTASTLPPVPPEDEDDDGSFQPNAISSLKMVSSILCHPGLDSQYLGLQTLCSLTDPTKMGITTARSIARELMQPSNDVGEKVAAIILKQSSEKQPRKHDYKSFELRVMAMTIFANSLQFVSAADIPPTVAEKFLPVLEEELRNATSTPRMAHIAAKCVEHLIENPHCRGNVFETLLESVVDVGYSKHMLLMHQAEVCLQKLRS